jgi:hypothetical protein
MLRLLAGGEAVKRNTDLTDHTDSRIGTVREVREVRG